jgi:hypothetical protein
MRHGVELRRLFPAVTDTAQARAPVPGLLPAGSPCPSRRARWRRSLAGARHAALAHLVLRELRRITDPLFRRAGLDLDE